MRKHYFWGAVVLLVAVLGSYVGLTVTDHPEQAKDLLAGVGGVLLGAAVLTYFYMLLG